LDTGARLTCGHCGGATLLARPSRRIAQPRSTFGSPDDVVDTGTAALAKQTERLGVAIARAVHGKSSAKAIRAAVIATGRRWNVERFADPLERAWNQGQWLGALDADFEARTNRPVKIESFAALHAPLLLAPYDRSTDPAFATRPVGDARKQFEQREPVTRPVYDAMTDAARRRAVTVAGAANKEIVRTVQRELVQQVAQGADLRDFEKRVVPRLEAAGWTPQNSSHVENVLRTNVSGAYNAGRARQMTQPAVLRLRPYWQIVTVNDGPPRQRPTHQAAHLVVLRADDPFWLTAYPPFGFLCRCRVRTLGRRQGEQIVVSGSSIHDLPDRGFTSGLSILDIPPPEMPPANDTLPEPANDTIPPQGSLAQQPEGKPARVPKFKKGFGNLNDAERTELEAAWAAAREKYKDPSMRLVEPPAFEFKVDKAVEHMAEPVVEALNEAGFADFYGDRFLGELHIVDASDGYSEYAPDARGSKSIAIGVKPSDVPRRVVAMGDPSIFTVSEAEGDHVGDVQATAVHEFGHGVHLYQRQLPLQKEVDAVVAEVWADPSREFISKRANEYNRDEYFAEAFTAYHRQRDWLRANAPKAFDMVERVLKLRGLL
jgi:hypothetical protein